MAYIDGKQVLLAGLKGDPGRDGDPGKDGAKGDSVFIRYSDSAEGSDFSESRGEGMDFIGFATGQTAPTYKAAYEWFKLTPSAAEVVGSGSRTYVVDTLEAFLAQIELGASLAYPVFDNLGLTTGDQVIIKDDGFPSFWFEKGGSVGDCDEYDHNGTSHSLAVYKAEGVEYIGTFHPIQSATAEPGSRTYVVDTLEEFLDTLASGNICPDCNLDNLALQNGDQVIIKTGNHPSFWFERDGEPVDYSYNGVVHSLGVWEGIGWNLLGTFHPSSESLQMKDKVGFEDYASLDGKAGIVRLNKSKGVFRANLSPELELTAAQNNEILAKKQKYQPITPAYLDYAVKVGVTTNTETLTEEEKAAAQRWLGIDHRISTLEKLTGIVDTEFVTIEGTSEIIAVPDGALPFAQIMELHGAHAQRGLSDLAGYYEMWYNYPKRILTDTGKVLFEMPSDAESHLPELGLAGGEAYVDGKWIPFDGNHIYFEDGKAYYKQTVKTVNYYEYHSDEYVGAEGETYVDNISDDVVIIRLAAPIVTDVTEYLGFDGVIDIGDASSLTVEMKHSEQDVKDASPDETNDVWNGWYDDPYHWSMGKTKIAFEV